MGIKIIFVDDEPNVLQGLKRMLFSMRKSWDMFFVNSGEEAIELLKKEKMDVIVTDMRMPKMNGAQLLEYIKEHFPHMIRIILSGHSDEEMAIKSTNTAHQFIAKPSDSENLKSKIDKTLKLRKFLSDDRLLKMVNGIGELPALPGTYVELDRELKQKDISINKIGGIISRDITLSIKILQLVNSAFFGLPTKITNSVQAVNMLGINIIKSLLLYIETFGNVKLPNSMRFYQETLWEHSFEVGKVAKLIMKNEMKDKQTVDDAFTAGILHDIGKLIMLREKEYYNSVFDFMEKNESTFEEAEKKIYSASHSEIGAYLIGLWGLPDNIVEAVAFHHHPAELEDTEFNLLMAVHIANSLVAYKHGNLDYKTNINIDEIRFDKEYISEIYSIEKIKNVINII